MKAVLEGYFSYVHCDVGSAYRQLEKAKLVGCWAHVRRKFFEATPREVAKASLAAKGLKYCERMFALEDNWIDLSVEEWPDKCQTELAPLMTEFFDWCRAQTVLSGFLLGKALKDSLNREETFKTLLTDGQLVLPNNLADLAIKSLVMGHQN